MPGRRLYVDMSALLEAMDSRAAQPAFVFDTLTGEIALALEPDVAPLSGRQSDDSGIVPIPRAVGEPGPGALPTQKHAGRRPGRLSRPATGPPGAIAGTGARLAGHAGHRSPVRAGHRPPAASAGTPRPQRWGSRPWACSISCCSGPLSRIRRRTSSTAASSPPAGSRPRRCSCASPGSCASTTASPGAATWSRPSPTTRSAAPAWCWRERSVRLEVEVAAGLRALFHPTGPVREG